MTVQQDMSVRLAELGYFVFRAKPRGKVPLTEHGFKDATRDERQILHAWESVPGANIGIDLQRSGCWVLDIDPREGVDPEDVIGALNLDRDSLTIVRTGEAPERSTEYPQSLSGVRGAHFWFFGHMPTGKTTIPGVEVRGDGAYVIAPGSVHESGVMYEGELPAVNGNHEVPEAIRALLRATKPAPTPAVVDGPIPAGARNDTLTSFAGSMRRRGMSEAGILAALRVENARCTPPLDDRDLQTIAHSIGTRAPDEEANVVPEPAPDPEGFTDPHIIGVERLREAIARAHEPPPWRVEPIAADGAVTTVAGMRGESKSWLGLCLCAAVARGDGVAGMPCARGPSLYVDAENGLRVIGRRFKLLGLRPDAFIMADGDGLRLPKDASVIRRLIQGTRATLCVLDSLRRLAPGAREDKSDDMAPIYAALSSIAHETGCAIVVLHHRSVKIDAPDTRGSSAIEDQSDLIFVLERERMDPEGLYRKRLRCTKSRIDREPKPRWLRFETVADLMTVTMAEPYEREGDELTGIDAMMASIRMLGPRVLKDGAWPPGRLAEALGVTPNHGTFRRALDTLVERGEWEREGATRTRVYRPVVTDSSQGGGNPGANAPPDSLFRDENGESDSSQGGGNWEPYRPDDPEEEEDDDDDWRQR